MSLLDCIIRLFQQSLQQDEFDNTLFPSGQQRVAQSSLKHTSPRTQNKISLSQDLETHTHCLSLQSSFTDKPLSESDEADRDKHQFYQKTIRGGFRASKVFKTWSLKNVDGPHRTLFDAIIDNTPFQTSKPQQ